MNEMAASVPAGSDGLLAVPFGNGAERVLGNRCPGAGLLGIDLNRHTSSHVLRAVQEGIAYSFRYGIDIMRGLGLKPDVIRAGKANMFLSPVFCRTLAALTGARVELFDTDGSLGAARGAALGAGFYKSREETFAGLHCVETVSPEDIVIYGADSAAALEDAYSRWRGSVELCLRSEF